LAEFGIVELKVKDTLLGSSNPMCILDSIVNIAANNKMVPLPLNKINVIAHEAEISNRYCLIADFIVNV